MARLRAPEREQDLRAYLLDAAKHLRQTYGRGDSVLWRELSRPVDALESRQAHEMHRYELPDDHPARMFGAASDLFVLGVDNVLRLAR